MIKFQIERFPDAEPEHRFRYTEIQTHGGKKKTQSEGFPTYQHADRAVRGTWFAICKQIMAAVMGDHVGFDTPPVPYTASSYRPKKK